MNDFLQQLNKSNLLASAMVIAVGCIVLHLAEKINRTFITKHGASTGEKGTAAQVMYGTFRAVIIAGCMFSVLQINGVDVTSVLAGVGIVSAFAGLAVQDFIKDIIMGSRILTDDFFKVGDVIQYGSFEGTVVEFDMRTTKLRSLTDGRILMICNRNISEISTLPKEMDVEITIPVPIAADPETVERAFTRAAEKISASGDVSSASYTGPVGVTGAMVNYALTLKCHPAKRDTCRAAAITALLEELRKVSIITSAR